VRVLNCEEKDYSVNGKEGKYYPTMIRVGTKVFNVSSKVSLVDSIDLDVDLEFELLAKIPKVGSSYTTIRVVAVV